MAFAIVYLRDQRRVTEMCQSLQVAQSKEKQFQALKGKGNHTRPHYQVSARSRQESNDKRALSPSGGQMDLRKYSTDKTPRQAHQIGLRGRLGGCGGETCRPAQPLKGSWVLPTGDHSAPACTPLPAVTGASELACRHKVPPGTRGDGLLWVGTGSLTLEAQEPKPGHVALPPGVPAKQGQPMTCPSPPPGPVASARQFQQSGRPVHPHGAAHTTPS